MTTKATRVIQDFSAGGGATVSHVALSPDRSMIAFGAHYQLSAADLAQGIPSERIWTMKADGTAMQKLQSGFPAASPGFTQTCNADPVCQAISAQSICGASGYCQLAGQTNVLDDLAWSPDGAAIWFTITQCDDRRQQHRMDPGIGGIINAVDAVLPAYERSAPCRRWHRLLPRRPVQRLDLGYAGRRDRQRRG